MEKQMTLAEAMLLGSAHMKPMAHITHIPDWSAGCALGMMMFANGKTSFERLAMKYPILRHPFASRKSLGFEIADRFNRQVLDGTYKLEEFVAWVAAQEKKFAAAISVAVEPETETVDAGREAVTTPA